MRAIPAILYTEEIAFAYAPTGGIETLADANNNLTKFEYDALDRLTHTWFPPKTTAGQWSATDYEQLTYNALDQIVAKKTHRPNR